MTQMKFEFTLERDRENGLWYLKSPQIPGLLAANAGMPEALEEGARCIRDLALAFAWEYAEGRTARPIFKFE
jgi:hypothetical protein